MKKLEFNPPVTGQSVFLIYICQQPDGVVTANSEYVGDSREVISLGLNVMSDLYGLSLDSKNNLYVSPSSMKLNAQ